MNIQDFQKYIDDTFHRDILHASVQNKIELHFDVDPKRIHEVCVHLDSKLDLTLISMVATDERELSGNFVIRYAFCDRKSGVLIVPTIAVDPAVGSFPSITEKVHAAALYEREISDLFGLRPIGNPDPKRLVFHSNWPSACYPLRRDFDKSLKPGFVKMESKSEFRTIIGDGIFEIPVGPVHAGIIEPGHFRFSLAGEPILNLEAQLYFTHKGIEKLAEGMSIERGFYLSERISGDETFTNSLAYCQAIEKIADIKIPARAAYMRVLFAELERLLSHTADLNGICTDVAFGFGSSQYSMIRNWCQNLAELLCGSRFLRSANKPGGVRRDFVAGKENDILKRLGELKKELDDSAEIVLRSHMLTDRVENTGILKNKIAYDLNAVGPAGRASGIEYDVRKAMPYASYADLEFEVLSQTDGDVSSRMKIKIEECVQSINLMMQAVQQMPQGSIFETLGDLAPYQSAFGITEAPRGENVHWIMSGENNTIFRYKVRTPSFCNWPTLCHAVSGNLVPDFPLINKSFNLSYAGNDL